mmetsp:Transcript_21052/g.68181  ORF Transcript_21052/g.68181 Transcript_21052/m.68181 type:complete len:128 (-) Transcript_21052:250-633(-)
MPTWQMPDAIHVVDGGLPTVGSKIAKEVLQSRSFRQEALVAELARARSKLSYQAKSDNPAPLHHSDRAHLAELDILFGDAVPALKGGEGDGFGDVRMCDWQDSLPSMTDVERESFILSARSLLASCK